ncbi:MAG: hypothetical protein HPY66_1595 [Firmicutes bacterium]|nr:hypothetical protein [Bacillota bacterium]
MERDRGGKISKRDKGTGPLNGTRGQVPCPTRTSALYSKNCMGIMKWRQKY